MHKIINNLIEIKKEIHSKNPDIKSNVKIIAVSKTFSLNIFHLYLNTDIMILVKIRFKRQLRNGVKLRRKIQI